MLAASDTTRGERHPVLDGVRGWAILLVSVSHIAAARGLTFRGIGEFGVWLFFVLSAFLLSLYFFAQPGRLYRWDEWANYALRRFLRIYPLFALAVLLGAVVGWWGYDALLPVLSLESPTFWAVYVEFKFYFLLPFVVVLIHVTGRWHAALPPALIAGYVAAIEILIPREAKVLGYLPWSNVDILFVEYLPVFLLGSLGAWYYVRLRDRRLGARVDVALAVMFLMPLLASSSILGTLLDIDLRKDWYHLDWVPWSLLFAVGLVALMLTRDRVHRFFTSPKMRFFGFVSYSTYLFQDFWIDSMKLWQMPRYLFLLAALAVIFATSYTLFVLIERPLSRITLWRLRRAPEPALAT